MTEHPGHPEPTEPSHVVAEQPEAAERSEPAPQAEVVEQVGPGERTRSSEVSPRPTRHPRLEPTGTGHPAVDAAVRAVAAAAGAPPADQVPAYQALHRTLRETLASIDQD